MGPKSTDKGPCESIMKGRHKKEGHVKMEAGPGGMWPQAKGHQSHQKLEETRKDVSLQPG